MSLASLVTRNETILTFRGAKKRERKCSSLYITIPSALSLHMTIVGPVPSSV